MKKTAYLIAIGGFAGSGKSTLARRVGSALNLPYYEIDFVGKAIEASRDYVGTNPKGVAFDLFWSLAKAYLENGNSIIYDQNLGRAQTWERLREVIASVPHAELVSIILDCPFEVCVERFEKRTEHPNLGEVDVTAHKFKWDYLNENEFPEAIRVDASRSQDAVFEEVTGYLSSLPCLKT